MIIKILLPIVTWLPTAFFWAAFILAAIGYIRRANYPLARWMKRLVAAAASYYLTYATLATVTQYYVFKSSEFSNKLLQSPLDQSLRDITFWGNLPFVMNSSLGYFIFYSWGRFWLGALLSIVAGLVFWLILKSLKKHRERFFEDGEVELGALAAMIAGWPQFVVFVPLVFLAVVLISIVRLAFFKEAYTTLGIPLLLAVLLIFIFSNELSPFLKVLTP